MFFFFCNVVLHTTYRFINKEAIIWYGRSIVGRNFKKGSVPDSCWLWIERLNSDGHQFYQYQQKEQSPLILTKLTKHSKVHDI